jgi:chromosome segregation ATPase
MNPERPGRSTAPLLLLPLLFACSATDSLMYQPRPQDPLDGYEGSLAQAGVNSELDWGPKQDLLLSEFKTLREEHAKLQKRLDQSLGEGRNLQARLAAETESLSKEKALRVQAEAEVELLRGKRRELEARVLGLSIEKARLEQTSLQARIAELQRSIEEATQAPAEAAAPVRR